MRRTVEKNGERARLQTRSAVRAISTVGIKGHFKAGIANTRL